MARLDELVAEIDGIPAYMHETAQLVSEPEVIKLRDAQATTIGAKIQTLKDLDMKGAVRVKKAIKAAEFTDAQNSNLSSLVDKQIRCTEAAKQRRNQQKCMSWELFPTETDWSVMGDRNTPWSIKYERAKTVCQNMVLMLPSETTRARILECLLLANNISTKRTQEFYEHLDGFDVVLDTLQRAY